MGSLAMAFVELLARIAPAADFIRLQQSEIEWQAHVLLYSDAPPFPSRVNPGPPSRNLDA
jgi:hypothetical protein